MFQVHGLVCAVRESTWGKDEHLNTALNLTAQENGMDSGGAEKEEFLYKGSGLATEDQ